LLGLAAAALSLLALPAAANIEHIPFPEELRKDVDFWIRVYTEATTSQGFLHDERDLGIVYRKLDFVGGITPAARREAIAAERRKIEAMLRRLAAGADDLSDEEQRIRTAFGENATRARFREAAGAVRFQLGQADRFREGVQRSGTWEGHIARTFARLGLPPELAVLPHVESSFDPTAYSKVGAAGMWQFMPGTGKRYMRIDEAVDERMDPFRATEAAAQLLDYNYRLLGSWPLALTAYNHGAAGMARAKEAMGTTDIATIVRNHKSRSFGFASRNFYVSFLAALTIDRNPEKYFPGIERRPEMTFVEVEMPSYIPASALAKSLGMERDELAKLNPALMPAVWEGRQFVPKGYLLRLPPTATQWNTGQLALRVEQKDQFLAQPRPRSYRVRSGDTLSGVGARHGVTVQTLASLNGISARAMLRKGQNLRLPPETPAPEVAASVSVAAAQPAAAVAVAAAAPAASQVARTLEVQRDEARTLAKASARAEEAEPVTEAEAREESPALIPGGGVAQVADSLNLEVAAGDTIRVAPGETLGHYADWLGISASRVRSLNGLGARSAVPLGRAIKLDFSKRSREQFVAKRRAFHETQQATFFAGYRIVATQKHTIRSGESLWAIASRHDRLPEWLLMHYNPDVDFSALRAGQQIVIPQIEAVPSA
jgi:membrane-bound lytic murein transglycosylase D